MTTCDSQKTECFAQKNGRSICGFASVKSSSIQIPMVDHPYPRQNKHRFWQDSVPFLVKLGQLSPHENLSFLPFAQSVVSSQDWLTVDEGSPKERIPKKTNGLQNSKGLISDGGAPYAKKT